MDAGHALRLQEQDSEQCWKGPVADKTLSTGCAGGGGFIPQRRNGGVDCLLLHTQSGVMTLRTSHSLLRDQTGWSKGLGDTPGVFHLELGAMADGVTAG